MARSNLFEMIKGRVREFRREPSAFFFVIFMPVLWMIILGTAFSGDKKESYSIGYLTGVGQEASLDTDASYQALKKSPLFTVHVGNQKQQEIFQKRGTIALTLKSEGDTVHYLLDPANPESLKAKRAVQDTLEQAKGRKDLLQIKQTKVNTTGMRYVDFLIPGLLALSIMTTSLFGTGMTIVVNRRERLLKQYLTTPMKPLNYILSHVVGRYVVLVAEFLSVMLTATLLFGFEVQGSWFSYIFFACVGTAAFVAISIFVGSKTENAGFYNGLVNLVSLPLMMLSGVWFSKEGFPHWLSQLADFLPLAPLVDGLRKISLEGASIMELGQELMVLVAYAVVFTFLAKKTFKWY